MGKKWSTLLVVSILAALVFSLYCAPPASAQNLYASIRGTVTDEAGAVVPDAAVTATNDATGVMRQVTSGQDGVYVFLQLPIGDYTVKVEKTGFRVFTATKIHVDVNQVYELDAKMAVGTVTQEVRVEANAIQVEKTTPQLGVVVPGNMITDMPLIGRNWVNLQQTEPGVVSASDGRGEFATNGSQTQQNSFLINGQDTNDLPLNTRLIIPSPDAIAEFRMVTSTINPEYGRNSGAVINALIKSGTNQFHGDAFEFYRDPFLNARNYFAPAAVFHQNQFGGTVGGPIYKNHAFFFFSYQGLRARQPQAGGDVPVYTNAERGGNFSLGADIDPETNKPYIAETTTKAPIALYGDAASPCPVSSGTKCAANSTPFSSLFSSGVIPTQDFDPIAQALMSKYVPQVSGTDYLFNPITTVTADQYLFRIDYNITSKDQLWGSWFWEKHPSSDTLPFTGATLPGFGETAQRHYKLLNLSWTRTLNDHMLNELRAGYTRFNYVAVSPQTPTLPSTAGFNISPQYTAGAGLPVINVTGLFSLGFSSNGPQPRIDQTYEITDNFSFTHGKHVLKFGFDGRKFLVYNPFYGQNDGVYTFGGAGQFTTTNPGADFLLGIPDSYAQGSGGIVNAFAYQMYSYAQDEFKLRPNFSLTYGLGWTVDLPIHDNYYGDHAMAAWVPGQQSTVFPNAPIGYVFQGDPGVHPAGTNHTWKYWGPRFGFAWSPDLGWLSGGPGKMSIRGGYGIYYNRSEEELTLQFMGMPPFTVASAGAASLALAGGGAGSPGFANPFVDIAGRGTAPNPFPFSGTVPSSVQFTSAAGYLPTWQSCCATQSPLNVDPMAENFNLTVERQLTSTTKMSVGYVGAVAHHLSIGTPVNIPTPFSNVQHCAADPNCDYTNYGSLYPQDFLVDPNIYGPIDQIANVGNSHYHSFQATLEHRMSHGLQFYAAYTWAHSIDEGSGFENSAFGGGGFGALSSVRAINPYCISCDYGNSSFDAKQRLVASVIYQFPEVHNSGLLSRATNGWTVAVLPAFQSGFPLDVVDSRGRSFVCQALYSDFACPDVPNMVAKVTTYDPRNTLTSTGSHLWFSGKGAPNADSFASAPLGSLGNAGRNVFRGPGLNNWDMELYKNTHITESTYVQLRIELYNAFNHTQFNPGGITTNFASSRFGQVRSAFAPRQVQLAAKFYF